VSRCIPVMHAIPGFGSTFLRPHRERTGNGASLTSPEMRLTILEAETCGKLPARRRPARGARDRESTWLTIADIGDHCPRRRSKAAVASRWIAGVACE
jgi:hypothetical protein